jgi:hypothetical protein
VPLADKEICLTFINDKRNKVKDLNIRTFLKVVDIYTGNPSVWRRLAEYSITAA